MCDYYSRFGSPPPSNWHNFERGFSAAVAAAAAALLAPPAFARPLASGSFSFGLWTAQPIWILKSSRYVLLLRGRARRKRGLGRAWSAFASSRFPFGFLARRSWRRFPARGNWDGGQKGGGGAGDRRRARSGHRSPAGEAGRREGGGMGGKEGEGMGGKEGETAKRALGDWLRTGASLSSPAARSISAILKGLRNSAPSALRTAPRAPKAGAEEPAARWLFSLGWTARLLLFIPRSALPRFATELPSSRSLPPLPSVLKTAQRLGSLQRKGILLGMKRRLMSSLPVPKGGSGGGFPSAGRFPSKVNLPSKRSHARPLGRYSGHSNRGATRGQGKGRSNFEWGRGVKIPPLFFFFLKCPHQISPPFRSRLKEQGGRAWSMRGVKLLLPSLILEYVPHYIKRSGFGDRSK